MNNHQAKEILSAYRPDGSDAQDKDFQEALEQCRHNAELQAWFTEQINFDASIVRHLREIRGPEEGKQAILAFTNLEQIPDKKSGLQKWIPLLSIGVAALVLLTISLFNSSKSNQTEGHFDVANFSIAELVGDAMPLDHRSKDRTEVVGWLRERNAPVPPTLPDIFQLATAEGCRLFTDGKGGQISLFCFEMDGELVHVLTFDKRTRQYFDRPQGTWWSKGDLNMIAFEADENLFAIATLLPTEKLGKFL